LCATLALGAPVVAFAEPQPAPRAAGAQKAPLELMVVHANRSGTVDPRAADIARRFQDRGFTGFKLLSEQSQVVSVGQPASFSVEGNRKVTATLVELGAATGKVRIQTFAGSEKQFDTTVTLQRDKAFLMAGSSYLDGKLIFAVTVD
jgi:hypothetical protein